MSVRARLEKLPAETEELRHVKKLGREDLAEISTAELRIAARWLRAAAYNAEEGARLFEHIADTRQEGTP